MNELEHKVARAICVADETAPEPDAKIYMDMREARAWEARIPQAQAALKAHGEYLESQGLVVVSRDKLLRGLIDLTALQAEEHARLAAHQQEE